MFELLCQNTAKKQLVKKWEIDDSNVSWLQGKRLRKIQKTD